MSIFHTVHDSSIATINCSNGDIVRVGYDEMTECPTDWDIFGASACRRVTRYDNNNFYGDDDTITAYKDYWADVEEWENEIDELATIEAEKAGVKVFTDNWKYTQKYLDMWADIALNYRPIPVCPVIVYRSGEFEAIVNKVQPDFMRGVVLEDLASEVLDIFQQWANGEVYLIEIERPNGELDYIGNIYGDIPTTEAELENYL